jgi:hypothetical protein
MSGAAGDLLHSYVCPLTGLALLAVGAWSSWAIWWSGIAGSMTLPPLTLRVACFLLGGLWGWFLTNVQYPMDPAHVSVGFPMPVTILARSSGPWLVIESAASLPCLLLNLVIGVGLANALLHLVWRLRNPRRS